MKVRPQPQVSSLSGRVVMLHSAEITPRSRRQPCWQRAADFLLGAACAFVALLFVGAALS